MKKISIITSHPIQYNAPLFNRLAQSKDLKIKVFYTAGEEHYLNDAGFGRQIKWDVPVLEGYEFEFLQNNSSNPGLGRFGGIRNQDIIERISEFSPDILWIYGWNYASHLKVMRYFSGKITIWFRGDSTLLNERPGIRKIFRRLFLHWVYQHVDKVLFVGKANENYFRAHGIKDHQMIFIPHAVDNDHFYDLNGKKYKERAHQWRKELGLPENAIVFLYAGKFISIKDPLLLLKAFIQVYSTTDMPVFLLFVGNGPLEGQLWKEASDHPNVLFLPFQNQTIMPVVYRLGNIFVLPSLSETWGLAINEAMASERAILASTKVGSSMDLIRDGVNGYTFTAQNLPDLQLKMQLLIQDLNTLENFGKESRSIIDDFSYQSVIRKILEII